MKFCGGIGGGVEMVREESLFVREIFLGGSEGGCEDWYERRGWERGREGRWEGRGWGV